MFIGFRFARFDDFCSRMSRWEDDWERGGTRHRYSSLPRAPEGRIIVSLRWISSCWISFDFSHTLFATFRLNFFWFFARITGFLSPDCSRACDRSVRSDYRAARRRPTRSRRSTRGRARSSTAAAWTRTRRSSSSRTRSSAPAWRPSSAATWPKTSHSSPTGPSASPRMSN